MWHGYRKAILTYLEVPAGTEALVDFRATADDGVLIPEEDDAFFAEEDPWFFALLLPGMFVIQLFCDEDRML